MEKLIERLRKEKEEAKAFYKLLRESPDATHIVTFDPRCRGEFGHEEMKNLNHVIGKIFGRTYFREVDWVKVIGWKEMEGVLYPDIHVLLRSLRPLEEEMFQKIAIECGLDGEPHLQRLVRIIGQRTYTRVCRAMRKRLLTESPEWFKGRQRHPQTRAIPFFDPVLMKNSRWKWFIDDSDESCDWSVETDRDDQCASEVGSQ